MIVSRVTCPIGHTNKWTDQLKQLGELIGFDAPMLIRVRMRDGSIARFRIVRVGAGTALRREN